MKSYRVTIDGWVDMCTIYAAEKAGAAKYRLYLAAQEAGYEIKITRFRAVRDPRFDALAAEHGAITSLGWADGATGYGCLAS